ncbi:hypothetical protein AURDEDRAFT_177043 [Auricularia subglabra TFB-10046 SS5]|nr:hypothetical protein AURDEDRAFT_177043 [Auricularia subglabra TFB-10046 SS5]
MNIADPKKLVNDAFLKNNRAILDLLQISGPERDMTPAIVEQLAMDRRDALAGNFGPIGRRRAPLNLRDAEINQAALDEELALITRSTNDPIAYAPLTEDAPPQPLVSKPGDIALPAMAEAFDMAQLFHQLPRPTATSLYDSAPAAPFSVMGSDGVNAAEPDAGVTMRRLFGEERAVWPQANSPTRSPRATLQPEPTLPREPTVPRSPTPNPPPPPHSPTPPVPTPPARPPSPTPNPPPPPHSPTPPAPTPPAPPRGASPIAPPPPQTPQASRQSSPLTSAEEDTVQPGGAQRRPTFEEVARQQI